MGNLSFGPFHQELLKRAKQIKQAQQTIEDLKEALKNAAEINEKSPRHASTTAENSNRSTEGANGGPAPLFYAMEKQAELNTARSEINRLANLLSDAQSEKMEAYDATQEMRKRMEDAEARLKRYEKLRPSGGTTGGSRGNILENNGQSGGGPVDSGAVNIEYLKNTVIKLLTAPAE